jgi:hypothetical protein
MPIQLRVGGWSDDNERILEKTPSEELPASTPPPNGPLAFPPLYFPDGGPVSFATWEAGEQWLQEWAKSHNWAIKISTSRLKDDQIRRQLHDVRDKATDTRILVVSGLGGSGKSQLVLNYVREYLMDYTVIFWVEAGQKESIERDYLQIYKQLFEPKPVTKPDTVSIEDAVVAVKRWFHNQTERSLVVLDSADDDHDISYINLDFFLPDAPTVDVIITTRDARAAQMTTLAAVEVGEMETTEAAELFQKYSKLSSTGPDVNTEVLYIVNELGKFALAYRERRKQLLGMKTRKLIHRYGESVLSGAMNVSRNLYCLTNVAEEPH